MLAPKPSIAMVLFACWQLSSAAQVTTQPTPAPAITAEGEAWFLRGEPLTYAGAFYYPAGPQIFFNANEMVRSGFYMGIPLYSRTTLEPFSIVFVPVGRGLMQPYERQRSGDLAGTAGSTAPALPVAVTPDAFQTSIQAAGPPASVIAPAEPARPNIPSPMHTRIGPRPQGINAVFVEFRNERWSQAGDVVPFDGSLMTKIGDRGAFPVYADSAGSRIYIPVTATSSRVVPYTRMK